VEALGVVAAAVVVAAVVVVALLSPSCMKETSFLAARRSTWVAS